MKDETGNEETAFKRRYLRRGEAATYLNCSLRHIDQLKHDGELPFIKMGARVVYDIEDLDAYAQDSRICVKNR